MEPIVQRELTEQEEDQLDDLFDKYVPLAGPAEPGNPEFLRMVLRVRYELYNNGGGNDKTEEIEYLTSRMKTGDIPKEMHSHVHFVLDFLRDQYEAYDSVHECNERYQRACSYSDELARLMISKFEQVA